MEPEAAQEELSACASFSPLSLENLEQMTFTFRGQLPTFKDTESNELV